MNAESANCKEVRNFSQWYFLFGSVPLNKPDISSAYTKTGHTYRIIEKATPTDIALSVLFGIGGSFTTKTIVVEACPSDIVTIHKKDTEAWIEAEKKKTRDEFLSQLEKDKQEEWEKFQIAFNLDPELTTVLLKSGEIKKGDVQSMGGETIRLIVDKKNIITIEKSEISKIKFPEHAKKK